jgi:hypothetical protein
MCHSDRNNYSQRFFDERPKPKLPVPMRQRTKSKEMSRPELINLRQTLFFESDGHPIMLHSVLVRQATRHLRCHAACTGTE